MRSCTSKRFRCTRAWKAKADRWIWIIAYRPFFFYSTALRLEEIISVQLFWNVFGWFLVWVNMRVFFHSLVLLVTRQLCSIWDYFLTRCKSWSWTVEVFFYTTKNSHTMSGIWCLILKLIHPENISACMFCKCLYYLHFNQMHRLSCWV